MESGVESGRAPVDEHFECPECGSADSSADIHEGQPHRDESEPLQVTGSVILGFAICLNMLSLAGRDGRFDHGFLMYAIPTVPYAGFLALGSTLLASTLPRKIIATAYLLTLCCMAGRAAGRLTWGDVLSAHVLLALASSLCQWADLCLGAVVPKVVAILLRRRRYAPRWLLSLKNALLFGVLILGVRLTLWMLFGLTASPTAGASGPVFTIALCVVTGTVLAMMGGMRLLRPTCNRGTSYWHTKGTQLSVPGVGSDK